MRARATLAPRPPRGSAILWAAGATLAARLVARAALVVFVVVLARLLPVEEYGEYAYLVALALTIAMLSDTGVSLAGGREIARGRLSPRAALVRALPVIGLATVAAACALTVLGLTAGAQALTPPRLALLSAYVCANGAFNLFANVLRSAGRSGTEALLQIGSVLVFLAGGTALAVATRDVDSILAAFVAKELAAGACALALVRRLGRESRASVDGGAPSRAALVRAGLALAFGSALLIGYTRIGLVVLANLGDATATGLYAAASRLLETGVMLGGTLGFALAPGLTRLAVADPARARALALRIAAFSAVGAAVPGGLLAAFRREAVTLVFGDAYLDAVAALTVFAVGLPAIVLAPLVGQLAVAIGRDRTFLLAHGLGIATAAFALGYLGTRDPTWVAIATVLAFGVAGGAGVVELVRGARSAARTAGSPAVRHAVRSAAR